MKRFSTVLSALVMSVALLFTACGGNTDNTEKEIYYTVTFDSQGGSEVESQRVLEGNPAHTPKSPTRGDDIFQGWYKSDDENAELWHFTTDRVTCDITLYAFWKEAEEEQIDTIVYELNSAKTGYIVKGDNGQSAAIVIPAEHEGLPVVEIGDSAFAYSKHNSDIISVIIPDTVTTIGKNAFYSRGSDLTTFNIGENSNLTTIGNNAFSGCRALKSIWLPATLLSIGDSAFNNCGSLDTITVAGGNTVYSSEGNNLIEIPTHTLVRGSNNSIIPESVTTIAQAAFRRAALSTLIIPVSVTSIGNYIIQDSSVSSIKYEGTAEQWEAVAKTKYWNMGKTDIEVVCSDEREEITEMYITINGNKRKVTLAQNSTVTALVELLKKGDITYTANDYGGFEKVGGLGHTLPTNHVQTVTEPGDIVLYQTNQIVMFYGSNSWSYTRIGKINYSSQSELETFLGAGNGSVQITLSLN